MEEYVFLKLVDVYDDEIFTPDRVKEWKNHIVTCYKTTYNKLKSNIDNSSPISFFLDKNLLEEVFVDAIVDMRKITDTKLHDIEDPNAFKIAAYLSYWWVRHKPVSIHYPSGYNLNDIVLTKTGLTHDEYEKELQKLVWRLKHINEMVAVQIAFNYIFDLEKPLCNAKQCVKIKEMEKENFCFESFLDMQRVILKKLTYFFAYRTLDAKMIEHMLEGYTLHPAWGLTGPQWSQAKQGVQW